MKSIKENILMRNLYNLNKFFVFSILFRKYIFNNIIILQFLYFSLHAYFVVTIHLFPVTLFILLPFHYIPDIIYVINT